MTLTEKKKAIKKCEIAIDKIIDICDMGFGDSSIESALDILNTKITEIESKEKD